MLGKVEKLQNFPQPQNVKQLKSFLGLCTLSKIERGLFSSCSSTYSPVEKRH